MVQQNVSHLTADSWARAPHPGMFLIPGVIPHFCCLLPHCAQGPLLVFSGYFCFLSIGLCGGCSLLFSEWRGKILALWLLSNGGGNCWGADRGIACCPPELMLLTRATPGSQHLEEGEGSGARVSRKPLSWARISLTSPAVQSIMWTCKGIPC